MTVSCDAAIFLLRLRDRGQLLCVLCRAALKSAECLLTRGLARAPAATKSIECTAMSWTELHAISPSRKWLTEVVGVLVVCCVTVTGSFSCARDMGKVPKMAIGLEEQADGLRCLSSPTI